MLTLTPLELIGRLVTLAPALLIGRDTINIFSFRVGREKGA